MSMDTATVKKPTSLKKEYFGTLKGRITAMEPATTDTMNDAAPINSPMARLPLPARIDENVENTSGLPFPNARKVTPATLWSNPRKLEMLARFGQKKSDAEMPSVVKRNVNQTRSPMIINTLAGGEEQ